jgi:hypothetical protein
MVIGANIKNTFNYALSVTEFTAVARQMRYKARIDGPCLELTKLARYRRPPNQHDDHDD